MTYKASLDYKAKAVTIGVTIVFAFLIISQAVIITDEGRRTPVYTTALCLIIYLVSLLFKTSGYKIDENRLIIKRWIFDVKINKEDILTIDRIEKWRFTFSIRFFGMSRLFGYYGEYLFAGYGPCDLYVTRRDTMVLITTKNNKKIVLSPDDQDIFLAELKGII